MPLSPLPADPKPTDEEIRELSKAYSTMTAEAAADFARMDWRRVKEINDPNALLVPFQCWVHTFPDGAPDYQAYQKSRRWHLIRRRILVAAKDKCACCPHRATLVHHRDYRPRVLLGEDLTPLVALCESCHDKVHIGPEGKRNKSWDDEEATLVEMVRKEDERLARR